MFHLTPQERLFLAVLAGIIFFGSALNMAFKKYPQAYDLVNLIEGDRLYLKVDVNRVSSEELEALPYIGPHTAGRIVAYRERRNGIRSLEEIQRIPGIYQSNYDKFKNYLMVNNRKPTPGVGLRLLQEGE